MRKDVGWKSFFEDNRRYADVINGVGCNGKQLELRCKTVDFPINLIDIRRHEDTGMFQTDVKYVFDFIRCTENKERLYELVSGEPYYRAMDEDAFDVVSMYTNSKELVGIKEYEGKDGKRDVCQAIKDLMEDSRQEGREEGIKEGMAEGIEQNKRENARSLLGLLSDEIIAEKIGLPLERVKALHEQEL